MKKINMTLEMELAMIDTMIKMRLLTIDDLEEKLKEISKKYDMTIVLRNKNRDTKETTIKCFG